MTDEHKPDPYEALRLEVERLRYQNERFRTHLERWRTDVQPLHEAAERSREMAFQFAQTAIKSMFLLNGGALIAFPAFAEIVGTAFRENVMLFILSIGAFVAGLALVAVATILAYKAMDADAEGIRRRQEVVKIGLNRTHNPDWYTDEVKKAERDSNTGEKLCQRKFAKLSFWGLCLGVASLAAFLAGATFGALVLSAPASASTRAEAVEAAPVVAEVSPEQETTGAGGILTGLLTWTDEHQGAVAAIATAVVAVASVASFFVAFFLARENRLLRKAGTEPEVVAYLLPDSRYKTMLNFVLANIGQGPARDVSFEFVGDAQDFADHNVEMVSDAKRKAISVLPQGERLTAFFGAGYNLFKEPWLRSFQVRVSYANLKGKRSTDTFTLDIAQFDGMITLGQPAEHEIAEAVKKFAKVIESWSSSTSGMSRLAVETITTEEGRKQMDEWRAARKAQGATKDPEAGGAP